MKVLNLARLFEIADFESANANFTIPFKKLTKKYGREFIAYARAAWLANVEAGKLGLREEEFCRLNGDMPLGFFNNKIKT